MLCLNWNRLFGIFLMISDCPTDVALKNILSEYQDVFKDELGTQKMYNSQLPLILLQNQNSIELVLYLTHYKQKQRMN